MARREQFVNRARSQLSLAVTNIDTLITVDDGNLFPLEGDFCFIVGEELMLVTSRTGDLFTVERGTENTLATSHDAGVSVNASLTAGGLANYQKENTWSGNQSPALRIYDLATGGHAEVADFVWLNQGGATAIDRDGRIVMQVPNDVGTQIRGLFQSVPSTPYSIVLTFSMVTQREAAAQVGLTFRESSTGKMMGIYRHANDTLEVIKHDSAILVNTSVVAAAWQFGNSVTWFRIEDDGTDLKFYVSPNGQDWLEFASEGRTVFMAGGPDEIGFVGNPEAANTTDILMEVYGFGEI